MKLKILSVDSLVLIQFIGFLVFFFASHNPYKSVMLYFSFMTFFCYWLIKIVFSKDAFQNKDSEANKKV